jgi:pyruvate-formate lyase-activating enzyme
MNNWQKTKRRNGWKAGMVDWIEGDTAYLSVVFSWNLPQAYELAAWYAAQGCRVRAGGPAVSFNPGYLANVAEVGGEYPDAVARHNPKATFTQRGCVRNCPFCIVPKIEQMNELDDWPVRPVVCDNNFLACSDGHFDRVVDSLKPLKQVDFNQGLDARLLTKERAERLAELDMKVVRLAWDNAGMERRYLRAVQLLTDAGFPASRLRTYVLIGFNDTPEDALYRLETVRALGVWPNPMRFQPLDSLKRNEYVGPNWTDAELKRFMRYWANLRYTGAIPFEEFARRGAEPTRIPQEQMELAL